MVNELLFFGCSHTYGEGAEWPELWNPKLSEKISPQQIYNKSLNRDQFVKILLEGYDNNWEMFHLFADKVRKKNRWTTLIEQRLKIKCTNYGFSAASNNAICDRILYGIDNKNLDNKIIIFVSTYSNRFSFFNNESKTNDSPLHKITHALFVNKKGQNYNNFMHQKQILLAKLYIESLGGRFYTICFENQPMWEYNTKLRNLLGYSLLSEKSVVDYLNIKKLTRYDGHHFDKFGQEQISDIFYNFLKDKINE